VQNGGFYFVLQSIRFLLSEMVGTGTFDQMYVGCMFFLPYLLVYGYNDGLREISNRPWPSRIISRKTCSLRILQHYQDEVP